MVQPRKPAAPKPSLKAEKEHPKRGTVPEPARVEEKLAALRK